jgi:signal transduction histidine kinase
MGDRHAADATPDQTAHLAEQLRAAQAAQARQLDRMSTLTGITAQLLAATELEAVLHAVVASASRLCDARGALISLIEPDGPSLRPRAVHGALAGLFQLVAGGERLTEAYLSDTAMGQAINRGTVVVVEDYARWPAPPARRARALAMGARSFVIAPLRVGGTPIGVLVVGDATPRTFAPEDVALVQALADQVALAIEQARLHAQQRRTAQELTALLAVSRAVSATLEPAPLLGVILDQLKLVVEYTSAVVVTGEEDGFRSREYRGPLPREVVLSRPVRMESTPAAMAMMAAGEPLIIADVWGDSPEAVSYRAVMGEEYLRTTASYLRCLLTAPMIQQGRLVGALVLTHQTPGFFMAHHAALATAVANHAAVALENARLYGEAQKLAALEERQRLARELHDSVSQVLFSIGLGARTIRTLLDRHDPARAIPSVEYIAQLAEMGTAEMRALLFELRPESLAQEGLVAALTKQAAALRARHRLAVETALCDEPDVPLVVKEAAYRIAQEATHNTVKHARASRITLRLTCDARTVALEVHDDGQGFDPGGRFPGHLGLVSMRERVERLGGTLAIESAPGQGTRVVVHLPTVSGG